MSGFNFERDLPHQSDAIQSIMSVFSRASDVKINSQPAKAMVQNPIVSFGSDLEFGRAVLDVQKLNQIHKPSHISTVNKRSRVLDISMETGTGKTYTFTKTMFELNKAFGIDKFIVVVPTLSIKAGTVGFLRSEAAKRHFMEDYNDKQIKVHVVESIKGGRGNKANMPRSIVEFAEARKQSNPSLDKNIHVLVINAGMVNSDTLQKKFDTRINDAYDSLFDAIASVNPVTFIDEPHKFKQANVTWQNILKFNSQYILRFGATFDDQYDNLIHELTAVDAFNLDLVKGVVADIEVFDEGDNEYIRLISHGQKVSREIEITRGKNKGKTRNREFSEARFEYFDGAKTQIHKLIEGESLAIIHPELRGITIEKLNTRMVMLSNGLELRANEKISPYSYSSTIQDKMIRKAVKRHFELEKDLLTRDVKIKPLTLFFIDDIEGYRGEQGIAGELKTKFEALLKQHIKELLDNNDLTPFYREYLERSLNNLSLCHGGYFSRDNNDADEAVEQEITDILHDKESLLSLDNPRRFIFSKWTLREGWDNPNVFQICKLRSSGSQTSKLQEVGRGLRLPVNEFMSRVKDETFELFYYVDFTEKDFAKKLVDEINAKAGTTPVEELEQLTDEIVNRIIGHYPEQTAAELRNFLGEKGAIDFAGNFKEGGADLLKAEFPQAFDAADGLKKGKVRVQGEKATTAIRTGKYNELRHLWEAINQRVILEYKIKSEKEFLAIFKTFLLDEKEHFKARGSVTETKRLTVHQGFAALEEEDGLENEILPIVTLKYSYFVEELAKTLSVNMLTLHQAFVELRDTLNIRDYLNYQTIRIIKAKFHQYMLDNAFSKFEVGYLHISNCVHPTALTDANGDPLTEIAAHSLGSKFDDDAKPANEYLFEDVFYDSPLEKSNIQKTIKEVTVFTKIPRNSIRIPVAGGGTYSPDFAYVVEYEEGKKQLNLVIETKDKQRRDFFSDEKQKIAHAESMFNSLGGNFEVKFREQLKNHDIKEILQKAIQA